MQHQTVMRKEWEDKVRRNPANMAIWFLYAQWEEQQRSMVRARSIFERAIDVDHRSEMIWLKYAEMEGNVNHARNIWDRAVALLPRVEAFWYKYTFMEEMLANVLAARAVFERWMEWIPQDQAWYTYVKFEERYGELDKARKILERYLVARPKVASYLYYAKFETKHGEVTNARTVFERALAELGEEANDEALFIAFAKFEEKCNEVERTRAIYKYALDHLSKERAHEVYKMYTQFEKTRGDRDGIEAAVVAADRMRLANATQADPLNYDHHFDWFGLELRHGTPEAIREVLERAIALEPPIAEKRFWRRYIYLWINYALYEELETGDMDRTRMVYQNCLARLHARNVSFSKIWIMYAHFEVRQKRLEDARAIFRQAIKEAPKDKLFEASIRLELQLGEVARCRRLYEQYILLFPSSCNAWLKYAELETSLGEVERARGLYSLAIEQKALDMPEVIWKAFIDFEVAAGEIKLARKLYEDLLKMAKHVKVWISFAQFEVDVGDASNARHVMERGNADLKLTGSKDERAFLLKAWLALEEKMGDEEHIKKVKAMQPTRQITTRPNVADDGSAAGWKEVGEYVFPGEDEMDPNLKLLQLAQEWRRKRDEE